MRNTKIQLTTHCQGTVKSTEPDSEITQMTEVSVRHFIKYHIHEQTIGNY